ncbi:Molybdopterin oxidoreductase Fe4S4 region [Pseudodesulfovibrio piezophilus C1TLV30]|nr:Molybdopterin oxidoreductase Fe4S4 region [Pseudodesulfovibrio piezophilus C1TLV30]
MHTNRRNFLKLSATAAVATAFGGLGLGCTPKSAMTDRVTALTPKWSKQTTTVCCYCAVGCGLIVNTSLKDMRAINVEGDPDHPVNEGSLCAKGASIWQVAENDRRPDSVLYRAPYSSKFKKVSLAWALEKIAHNVKKSRDETFTHKNSRGEVVNRCDGIASLGSAALDNEECWAYQTMLRSLGLVYIEHQARI